MFESATWTTTNRRNFAVVEALYADLGIPLRSGGWDLADDVELAGALAHLAGTRLLQASIIAASSNQRGKPSKRSRKSAWKNIDPEGGARAAVYLTLGIAAMSSAEIVPELDPAPVERARRSVEQAFDPPGEDLEAIEAVRARVIEQRARPETHEATERGGTAAESYIELGEAALSFQAIELAGAEPRELPAFEVVADVDPADWADVHNFEWFMTLSVSFPIAWTDARNDFLEIAFEAG